MKLLTENDLNEISLINPYWIDRWSYISKVVNMLKEESFKTVLELGPNKLPVVIEADIMAIKYEVENQKYVHDATVVPWPIRDKSYDIFISLQVWEHLGKRQQEAFREVKRISKKAILSFPLRWDCPEDPVHHMITEKRILSWTCFTEPVKKEYTDNRLVCLYEFEEEDE